MIRSMARIAGCVAAVCGCLIAAADAGAEEAGIPVDRVVAHVNEHRITLGEIKAMILPRMPELQRRYRGAELESRLEEMYRQALEQKIERRLILDAYEQQEGRIPEWAVDQHVDEVVRQEFDGDSGALVRALARERVSLAEWRENIKKSMIVSSMQGMAIGEHLHVSPAEIRAYYARHRDRFRDNDEVAPLAEAQAQIESALREKKAERRHAEWIARLKEKAYVRVLDEPS